MNLQLEEFRAGRKGGEDNSALRAKLAAARKSFAAKLEDLAGELKHCWREWDALIARERAEGAVPPQERRRVLDRMADVLDRRRYVQNLMGEISAALTD